ncbi:HAMP domain-containing histidine kinase [bacterium]|nr:HAMP domain-containing histidine kinase [bacterium]
MFFHRIRNRMIAWFILFAALILGASGWMLYWSIRQNLEKELGSKLEAVAGAAAVLFSEEEMLYLAQDTGPRFREYASGRLERLREQTRVKRIFLFDWDLVVLADSRGPDPLRKSDIGLKFYSLEIEALQKGKGAHSILFTGMDGAPAMTGFAPLSIAGNPVGGAAVESSVPFLEAVQAIRDRLIWIGIAGVLSAVLLGTLMAGSLTRPIRQLSMASRRISSGRYEPAIPVSGQDEIADLASTLETMRRSIITRERELKTLVAGVAHEIRNPLGGMELFSGLLADEVRGNAEASGYVSRIRGEIGHIQSVVNRFMDFARPQKPVPQCCSPADCIAETAALLPLSQGKNRIDMRLPESGSRVWADPNHLKEILLNLMKNAVEVMREGGRLSLEIRERDRTVEIRITDTGPGIPAENREQVFAPFFTTRNQGTGLGLSIARALAEANGGSLALLRSDSGGTEFALTLNACAPGSETPPGREGDLP